MNYEKTPIKESKGLGKKVALKAAESLGTDTILWLLVKRHKIALLGTWAVVVTALYMFPPLPDVILKAFGR